MPRPSLIAYRHGLRATELVALRWDDIDFAAGKLHVRRAKGGTASVHPIGGRELRALRRLKRETPACSRRIAQGILEGLAITADDTSLRCPLYPRKRTLRRSTSMSALCQ